MEMSRENLNLYYTPIVNVESAEIVGLFINPHLAGENSEVPLLDCEIESPNNYRDLLTTALRHGSEKAYTWSDNNHLKEDIFLQVPIHTSQFNRSNFASLLQSLDTKVPYDFRINLGFGERELENQLHDESISLLKNQFDRFNLAVRDFGQGYASLMKLSSMPVESVNLIPSRIKQRFKNKDNLIDFVRSMIDYAHSMDLTIIAEEVNSSEEFHQIHQCNCSLLHGSVLMEPTTRPEKDFLENETIEDRLEKLGVSEFGPTEKTLIDELDFKDDLSVLVVSESQRTGEILSRPLRANNVIFQSASTIDEAREHYSRYDYDLIVLEFNDEELEECLSFYRRVLKSDRSVFFLLLGTDEAEFAEELNRYDSVKGFLEKPLEVKDYVKRLNEMSFLKIETEKGPLSLTVKGLSRITGLSRRKMINYVSVGLVALLLGLLMGPALASLSSAVKNLNESIFSQTNYLKEKIEKFEGFLRRDERRERRQM